MDARKEYEKSARRASMLAHKILEAERELVDTDLGATAVRTRVLLTKARSKYYAELDRAKFFGSLLD